MTRSLRLIAVSLPIAFLVFMIASAEWQLADSRTWHFAIRGYDPRDLLRGHYVLFQVDVDPAETIGTCAIDDPDCCYCLSPGDDIEARVALAPCAEARSQCEAFVRTAPLHALRRFYIPEAGRIELESRLRSAARERRAHVAVAVSASGEPMIEALLVDGQPLDGVEAGEAIPSGDSDRGARTATEPLRQDR